MLMLRVSMAVMLSMLPQEPAAGPEVRRGAQHQLPRVHPQLPGQTLGLRPPPQHPEEAGQGRLPPHRADLLPQPQGDGEEPRPRLLQCTVICRTALFSHKIYHFLSQVLLIKRQQWSNKFEKRLNIAAENCA